jgi:hypothetical protein
LVGRLRCYCSRRWRHSRTNILRAAACGQRDALPNSPDRRVYGSRKFRPLSGRPSPGFRGAWSGWHPASLDPEHGFAGGPASSRLGGRGRYASTLLVSRRTVRRVRCRRQAQKGGRFRRPASNPVRFTPWECRRGWLLESRWRNARFCADARLFSCELAGTNGAPPRGWANGECMTGSDSVVGYAGLDR